MTDLEKRPMNICLLTYRGNPTCGGQGVYIKHLSKALADEGHRVDVISGPPYPHLDENVRLIKMPSLDLYHPDHLFRPEKVRDLLNPINMYEFFNVCTGSFPEPFTFGERVYSYLKKHKNEYDIVHDNQCLSYGIGRLARKVMPTIVTIHHPITVDRQEDYKVAKTIRQKFRVYRWYTFIRMQLKVARQFSHIITVSEFTKKDIAKEFGLDQNKFRVVHNGINNEFFYPKQNGPRPENSLIVTNSADTPLKGLNFLLEAVARVRRERHLTLTVIGQPKKDGIIENLVKELKLGDIVRFTGRIENEEFADYYAKSTLAVVPSLYEGFGIPAAEAMACGVPLISTSGGALPEVVGDAGLVVPPADATALAQAITRLLDSAEERKKLAQAGLERVNSVFSWAKAAREVADVYREAIRGYSRFS
ncbi:MAG TPA: glycosyltransferase family 4 protein [Smithellaceae bacterium]|nr:glycosyltransferase family 4 protein [Smithellaceae bacterium]HQF84849.1 glycosyltransferase family 4 protein [Smithellaceae bacterium]HQG81157.1 glycosyltransferase family 4 protein [Smithellaceae bacterium]